MKNKILISIKPEYTEKIFNGSKKYEFRTKIAKKDIDKMVIYSTFPIKKVVGEVEILGMIHYSPKEMWEKTKKYAGISKDKFLAYFSGNENAYAYVLGKTKIYKKPKELIDYGYHNPPQSFFYINRS